MKVAAVGFTCIDLYQSHDNYHYPTGNGVNMLINLCRRGGVEGAVVTAVGEDEYGRLMRETLAQNGVDHSHVHTVPGGRTCVISMALTPEGDRVHSMADRGVMEGYDLFPGDLEFIQSQDILHTDLSWNCVPRLPQMGREGARIFFDFSVRHDWPQVPQILPHITWGMFSFKERTAQVERFLLDGCAQGPQVLIGTFGREGAIACDGKTIYFQPIVEDAGVVNTVGSGDNFACGFLHGMIREEGVQKALLYGAEASAMNVSRFGPY